MKLPQKVQNPNTPTTVLSSSTKPVSTTTLNLSSRMAPTPNSKEYQVFEENLPPNCFFKNETRESLPRDPVKLIKLKLMKKQTAKNLEKELKNLADQNRATGNQNNVSRLNKSLSNINQLIIEKRAKIRGMQDEAMKLKSSSVNQGRLIRCFLEVRAALFKAEYWGDVDQRLEET